MNLRPALVALHVLVLPAAVAGEPAGLVTLSPAAHVAIPELRESSGIVASRRYPGVFWSHNDSGDTARLFAFRADGSPVVPPGSSGSGSVAVASATNRDWEDITTDDAGRLYVGDIGNNGNARTDLAIYVVPEPDPAVATDAAAIQRIAYAYPDQKDFPPSSGRRNFDAESLFWADGTLWLLSKNYDDLKTRLYRFSALDADQINVPDLVGEFEVGGMVTGADVSRDGSRLALVGFRAEQVDGRRLPVGFLWVFERTANGAFFEGRRWHRRFLAGQVEAVTWNNDRIMMTNEPGDIFEVELGTLAPATARLPQGPGPGCCAGRSQPVYSPTFRRPAVSETLPDRLCVDPSSRFYDEKLLSRNIGIRFNGTERTNVEEYCVSEGWIRTAIGKTLDRKGKPLTMLLKGTVEPFFKD